MHQLGETQYPKGTTFKKDKDGFLIPVFPDSEVKREEAEE